MIRRLLVVIDSRGSESTVQYATALARQHEAAIQLLGIVDASAVEHAAVGAGPGASHYARELRERLLDQAQKATRQTLDDTAKQLQDAGLETHTSLDTGSVRSIVLSHSLRNDLVVVARDLNLRFPADDDHDDKEEEEGVDPGKALSQILRLHARPTLVVPKTFREIHTAVVAHDTSIECARNLFTLLQLRPFPDAKLLVVHANPEGGDVEDAFWQEGVDYLAAHDFEADVIVRNLEPAESVLEVVMERQADLVILGPYTGGAVRHFLFGSTCRELLERAKVPLLFGF